MPPEGTSGRNCTLSDEGPAALREWLFAEGQADRFVSFEKQNDVFTGSQAFTFFAFARGIATTKVSHIDGLKKAEDLQSLPEPIWVDIDLIRRMSGSYFTIPVISDRLDKQILEKLYAHPLITDTSSSLYGVPWSGDYNITLDRAKFVGGPYPVLEGKHIEPFRSVSNSVVRYSVPKKKLRGKADQSIYRITWRDIAGTLDSRRMIATMLPKQCVTSDLLNTLAIEGDDDDRLYLLGVMNSLVFEWRIRQVAQNNHIKPMAMRQMPCPRPKPDAPNRARIVDRVARLLVVDDRLSDLREYAIGGPIKGEAERHRAICEIDAAVAKIFGLNAKELDRILERFDKVPEETKRMVKQFFV